MSLADIPTTPEQWLLINEKLRITYDDRVTRGQYFVIWLATITGPITGVLYLASGWRRWNLNGRWWVRKDEKGYLHPHAHAVIAAWLVVFTLVNLVHSISLLVDCQSHLHPVTIAFHFPCLSLLSCVGWTRVWALLYALPPSTRGLAVGQKVGWNSSPCSTRQRIPATLFNSFIIIGHLISLLVPIKWMYDSVKAAGDILSSYQKYRSAYPVLVEPSASTLTNLLNEQEALGALLQIRKSFDILRTSMQYIGALFAIVEMIQLSILVWTSTQIVRVLYYQVQILRKAVKTQKQLENLENADYKWLSLSDQNKLIGHNAVSTERRRTSGWFLSKKTLKMRLRYYLPSFQPGTGISATVWSSGPFQKTERQVMDGGVAEMKGYHRQLRRYASNTLWQAVVECLIISSCLVLCCFVALGVFEITKPMQYQATLYKWWNITWNGGPGLTLGIISCIVAYSAAPSLPREPDRRTIVESDED